MLKMMNTQKNIYKEWDIYFAEVFFEDKPTESKMRPVLISGDNVAYLLIFKITSHEPRTKYIYDYSIMDWEQAGLKKPSTIRLGSKLKIQKENIIKRIGRLSQADILRIKLILYEKSN